MNPWEGDGIDFWKTTPTEKLKIPEPKTCEFCGAPREYLGLICKSDSFYDWEIKKWSIIPQHCCCDKAQQQHIIEEKERQKKEAEARQRMAEEAKKEKFKKLMFESGIKPRFLTRTFENFLIDTPGRKTAYTATKNYADNFSAYSANGDGLYIEGTFGTGKTHLAAAIAIQLMRDGHQVVFKTADDMLQDIKATFDYTGRQEKEALNEFKQCELLIIDDIGKEQATDWSTAQLYAIINDRYENQRPTIITTNFNEDELIMAESPKGTGSHRIKAIISRLHEVCTLVTMCWQDWRGTE